MDVYTFTVEEFIVHDTRATHNDTLALSYTAYVNGDAVGNRVIHLGDFDNGEFSTSDYVPSDVGPSLAPVVVNDPAAKAAFIFQLVNAGNVPSGALSGRLAATADQLAGITAGLAGAGAASISAAVLTTAFPLGLLLEGFANLWSWLTVDCDGPVAVDQISGPRYVLDAWTDNPIRTFRTRRSYAGTDSATGCGGNSNYEVIWSLKHSRIWMPVTNTAEGQLLSQTGVSAAAHHGALHTFGVVAGGIVNHARTFTGATWNVDSLGPFNLAQIAVSAISFNDRLHVFGVRQDGTISSLAYSIDGGSWTPHSSAPPGLNTAEPIAASNFRDRLYLVARDSASNQLHITSTSDLLSWNPWADVPSPGLQPASPVSAATLGKTLFIFGVYNTGKTPGLVVMRNSTSDGVNWSGWDQVEAGARPEGAPSDVPVDVAAGVFHERVYLATRWLKNGQFGTDYIAVNFSRDGDNWSGWRVPQNNAGAFKSSGRAGLAAVNDHLYILSPQLDDTNNQTTHVWAY